jgi:hypothetical protein
MLEWGVVEVKSGSLEVSELDALEDKEAEMLGEW